MILSFDRSAALLGPLAILISASLGWAQMDEISTRVRLPTPDFPAAHRTTKMTGQIKFEASQYQSSIPGQSHLDQSLLASANLKAQIQTAKTESLFDFTGESYLDWGHSQFSVQELYWRYLHANGKSRTTAGRSLEFWSQLDQDWKLGMWQPDSLFDSLRPVEQGLTGVFFKHREGSFESLAFVSPFFVPTMGPEVKEENGSLVAESRWHQSPSNSFLIFGKQRKVVYSLNTPDVWDLVQKPGAGYRIRWQAGEQGPWASASFGYKPMNNLLLKYDKKLGSTEEGEDTGSAPLYPTVGYHGLGGVDLGYSFSQAMISASYLEDHPQAIDQDPEDPFIVQRPTPMKAYSAHAETQVSVKGFDAPLVLGLEYLRVNGGTYQDFDSQGKSHGAVFSQRFHFQHAAAIETRVTSTLFKKPLISKIKYLREFEQRGMVGSAEFLFYPGPHLALSAGADVLGVDNPSVDNTDDRFLNQFRANDRVYGGVLYVF